MTHLDRNIPPEISDFEDYRLTQPELRETSNGIPIYYFQNPNLELLHFTISIRAGKNYETVKCAANMCYNILKEHRKGETSAEFSSIIDSFGAVFKVNVFMESININMVVPKRNSTIFLKTVFDLLLNPSFEENDLILYKEQKIKDLQYNILKVDTKAYQLLFNTFFKKGTPTQTLISEELINKVTLNQLSDYYTESFCSENITFFAAGNIDDNTKDFLNNLLSKIPSRKKMNVVSVISHKEISKNIYEQRENSVQSAIILCRRLYDVTAQFERELEVVTTLLGNYFGSRLMQNLREKNGYTYGISCDTSRFGQDALICITSEVNAENCNNAIKECYNEIERLQNETVGDDELQLVKNYLHGRLLRSVDGVISFMKYFSASLKKNCDGNEFYRQRETIRNMTAERIREIAQQILNINDFTEIIVGKR